MPYVIERPQLHTIANRWLRDSLRVRGAGGTLKYLATQSWEVLKDSMPERRRSRFGDIDYDCDYGVDTTWARLSWEVRLREIFTERLYQPTVPEEFGEIMQQLAPVDFTDFIFIDLGSGKGRALLLASRYPFRSIIGVEIQPELHNVAEENIFRLHESHPEIDVQAVCLDAREYRFPNEPLIVYMFNPFPDYAMATVVENLRRSVVRHPRPVYVIYNAPFEQQVIEKASFLHKVVQTHQYAIYSNISSED